MNFPEVYSVKHKDLLTRMASRSGGIFTALSDTVLADDGVVYGCVMASPYESVHFRAETAEERDRMRGSKYIQSNMGDIFQNVKKDLCEGRKVLFSGTSCQVAGLRAFLDGTPSSQLLCIDIVCHGVPSPHVWKDHVQYYEQKYNAHCTEVDFRNKRKFGWKSHIETLTLTSDDGSQRQVDCEDNVTMFYSHLTLRPSCYVCPYKDILHPGDITIADHWGIEKAVPGFNDDKGVSLVLINNAVGQSLFNASVEAVELRKCHIEDSMQQPLIAPFPVPSERKDFWKDYQIKSYEEIRIKYGTKPLRNRLRSMIGRLLRKYLRFR